MTERLISSPQKLVAGESPMIDVDVWTEVHARFRRGPGQRTMARARGRDRKPIKRLLAQARPVPYQRTVPRPSVVPPSLASSQRRAAEVDDHAYRLFQELQAQNSPGGDEMVQWAVRPLRAERDQLAEATSQQPQRWMAAGVFEAFVYDVRIISRWAQGRTPPPSAAI